MNPILLLAVLACKSVDGGGCIGPREPPVHVTEKPPREAKKMDPVLGPVETVRPKPPVKVRID